MEKVSYERIVTFPRMHITLPNVLEYAYWYKFLAGAGIVLITVGTIYENNRTIEMGMVLLVVGMIVWVFNDLL